MVTTDSLLPHQQRAIERLRTEDTPGLLLAWNTGSGKTRASIEAYKALGLPTTVVAPAALKKNYEKEMQKWLGQHPENLKLVSQELVSRRGIAPYDNPEGLLIADEVHRARDTIGRLNQELAKSQAKKRLLLSGTPVVNQPYDLANLVNLAAGKPALPETKAKFEEKFIGSRPTPLTLWQRLRGMTPGSISTLKNTKELKDTLNKYVDYHPSSTENYPTIKEELHRVPMGQKQTELYNTLMGKAPLSTRLRVKWQLPPSKADLARMKFFLTGPRQASASNLEYITNTKNLEAAKAQQAFDYFKEQYKQDPNYKVVAYDNYLTSGLEPYRRLLEKNKIPYGMFTGEVGNKERNEMVKQYNADKLKALLISSAGAEGLDLRNTNLLQVLSPHWNAAREKQVIGRAARYKSHSSLPPEKQNVLVQRYLAEPQAGWISRMLGKPTVKGTDEYIYNLAQQKEQLNRQVEQLLAQKQVIK